MLRIEMFFPRVFHMHWVPPQVTTQDKAAFFKDPVACMQKEFDAHGR